MKSPIKWWRSCKRRKPGIYLYITRRHLQPWRTERGYAGKSRNLAIRDTCHKGTCGRHANCQEKSWMDLVVRRYTLRLPWWLGWGWVLSPLEALAISIFRPRYNWQLNPRRDKVGPKQQKVERAVRDSAPTTYRAKVASIRFTNLAVRIAAAALIIVGTGGFLWERMSLGA